MDFYKRMNLVCCRIPRGKVATYGQIALLCQKPNNARQVGHALNRGLAGEVPAHRVVNAKGLLSGAAAFELSDLQKMLLEEEGVRVQSLPEGFWVNLKIYAWKNTMQEVAALLDLFEVNGI